LDIKEEDAIEAWKEMELERLRNLYEKSKKALGANCGKILKMFDENK
jgi:hypothetical protein